MPCTAYSLYRSLHEDVSFGSALCGVMRAPLVEWNIKIFLIFNNGLSRVETSRIGSRAAGENVIRTDVKHMRVSGTHRNDAVDDGSGGDGDGGNDDDNRTVFHLHTFTN